MTRYVLDQYTGGTLDYATLGFRANPGNILIATAAPDARWSVNANQSAAETVTRYTLGIVDPSYVEPGEGNVLAWNGTINEYVPTVIPSVNNTATSAFVTGAGATKTALDAAYARHDQLWFNVKKYGAVGDNSTNDATAIQSAITAAEAAGGTVFFPASTYFISNTTLTVNADGVKMVGTGPRASIVRYTGTGTAIRYGAKANTTAIAGCGFADMGITGTSSGSIGLHWIGVQNSMVSNIRISTFTGASAIGMCWDTCSASPFQATINSQVYGSYIQDCTNGWKLTKDAADTGTDGCNHNSAYGLRVATFTATGIDIDAGENVAMYQVDSSTSNNGTIGIRVNDDVCGLFQVRTDCSFGVGNTATGIKVTANGRDVIIDNPTGDGPTTRLLFDDPTVTHIVRRQGFNEWVGNLRRSTVNTGSNFWTAHAWKNISGSTIAAGEIGFTDSTCGEGEVKRSASASHPNPKVAVENVLTTATGGFAEASSIVTVLVDTGAVAVGDTLVTSTASNGRAMVNNAVTDPRFRIGYARTSKTAGSTGSVVAHIR